MQIEVPWLNTDIQSLMNGEPIIYSRKLCIRLSLYNMLLHRLSTGDADLSGELAFARTIAQTYEISN